MKKRRSFIVLLIAISLNVSFLNVFAENFAENESYYRNLCSSDSAKDNKPTCQRFNAYLSKKIENSTNEIEKYKGEISKYNDDMAKQVELAEEYQLKIDGYAVEIKGLENDIAALERSIATIEAEIIAREAEIEAKDEIIVERMKKTQSDIRFGYEIDFLFQVKDLASLVASASIMSDIMEYEAIQIEEINRLIEEQKVAQDSLVVQQETIEINIKTIESSKAQVQVLKNEVDIAVANYQRLVSEMESKTAAIYADTAALKKQIAANEKALETIESSGGFVRPISGGYISAKVWAYPPPWSAMHIGYDYASSVGTPIRAAANGVVIKSNDGCPTMGYLGNRCGGMAGNYVYTLVTVNGSLYGVSYFHMQQGTPIASGTVLSAGQTIGRVGSSGNSTGPHVHVEVIYLGSRSINDYLSTWNGSTSHNIGMNLSNRCINKGNAAPCRLDPGVAFGYN